MTDHPATGSSAARMLKAYWQPIALLFVFVIVQLPTFANWWGTWMAKESYYSHGVIVPFIAGFMLWTRRKDLSAEKLTTSWYGALLLVASLPTYAAARILEIRFLSMFSFFALLFGTVLLLFGGRMSRIMAMPFAFLITMIPTADSVIDTLTGRAQLVSAAVAERFFVLTGYEVERLGNAIYSGSLPEPLLVGTPCSGLRLLISLVTFSWFFLYVTSGNWWKKAFLMALSLPLAVFINSLRIAMIGYVGFWTGSSDWMHRFHDYSGYIGLVICFLILFGIAKLLKMDTVALSWDQQEKSAPARQISFGKPALVLVAAAFAVVGYLSLYAKPLYDLPKGDLHRENIPRQFGDWTSHQLEEEQIVKDTLNKGDLITLVYTNGVTNRSVLVFLNAALDTSVFHDPHLCLPGSGSRITNERVVGLTFEKPVRLSAKATTFMAEGDYSNSIILHWYMYGKKTYPLTGDIRRVRQSIMRSDLVRIIRNPFCLAQLRKEVRTRQFMWYRLSTDAYGEDEEDLKALESFAKEFAAHKKDFGQ